mgnify:CR=1 FL=1
MQNNSDISNSTGVKPERSPIITVLFFFGIVINIVSAIMTTTDYYIYEAIEYEPFLTVVCQDIINVVSLILLLYWKSIGFYLYAINTLIAYIVLVTLTGAEYELFDIKHNCTLRNTEHQRRRYFILESDEAQEIKRNYGD